MTNEQIKTVGQTIAQETTIGGNTAARVGGVVEGIGAALDNKDAAIGYFLATISGGSIYVNAPNYLLGSGGNLKIKMPAAATSACTLTIGNAQAVQLWYNGAAVSSPNTWDAGEIVSVYYDGTRFMASNSQGGAKFGGGQKVSDITLEQTLGSGVNSVISQKGVSDAVFNEIDINDIDDLKNLADALNPSSSLKPTYYTVTAVRGSVIMKVGSMAVISDNLGHVVTEIMSTHYLLDTDGYLTDEHDDAEVFTIFRSVKGNGGTLPTPVGTWTAWKYINQSVWPDVASVKQRLLAMMGYYVCDTAAGTADKTISASGYILTNGGCIRIKMANANTADNVTLNINSTGAKALYYDGAQASSTNTWDAGEVLEVYYDGTQYQCASGSGGKFATGEKVKETSITNDVVAGSASLPTSDAVEKRIEDGNYSSSTQTIIDVTKKTWLNANVNDAGFDTVIPVDDTGYCTTGYVDISLYREIEITIISKCQRNEINGKMGHIFYNEEYVPISSAVTNSAGTYALKTIKLSVPEGAKYIRFSCYPGNTNIVLWKYYPFLNVNDVINNLEDGGETKVLSAEMGKELATEMNDVARGIQSYEEMGENCFDISEQTTNQTTAANLSCTKTETGYSFVCAAVAGSKYAYGTVKGLTIGEKYEIVFDYTRDLKVSSTYAGLLRMMYEKPLQDITYGLVAWILKNYPPSGTIRYTFTAEYSTYYLRMAANDIGTGGSVTLSNIRVVNLAKSDYIKSIVDSTIGLPDSGVDTASVKGYYNGNRIPSIEGGSYEIGCTKVCNSAGLVAGQTIQACAAYNGYLFEFLNNNSSVHIYNLAASTPVLHSTVTPTNVSTGHCNTACFGSKKYDDADIFPLLYTSGGQTQDYNQVQVYRVTFENDVFTITQVQNITMPATTDVNKFYWAQIYLDNELNDMWYVGNGKHARWVKFKIPEIKDDGGNIISSVVLTDEDGQDEFYTLGFVHQQGGIIVNGYCYIMDGVPAWGDTAYMRVFDVWAKKMINNTVNLTRIGWNYEPEGIGLYDNHFYINTAGNGIFKFFF